MNHRITVGQLGVNDTDGTVYIDSGNGNFVSGGESIGSIETTKATVDIISPVSGYIRWLVEDGGSATTGDVAAIIFDNKLDADEYTPETPSLSFTKKALAYIEQHNIDIASLSLPEGIVISVADVVSAVSTYPSREDTSIQDEIDSMISLSQDNAENKKSLVIFGAGAGGRVAQRFFALECDMYAPIIMGDDSPGKDSVPSSDISRIKPVYGFVTIADHNIRLKKLKWLESLGCIIVNAVFPTASIGHFQMGVGNILKHNSVVEDRCIIGNGCIIDNGAIISHDCVIGNGVHIAPGAVLGGFVSVGDGTVVGIGASVSTGVFIGKNCIISPGASVNYDIPNNSVVDGVPGNIVGRTKERE